jgi:hypothetical protein
VTARPDIDYNDLDAWLEAKMKDRSRAALGLIVVVAIDILAWAVIIMLVLIIWSHL